MSRMQAPALVVDETTPADDIKRAAIAVDRTGRVIKSRYGSVGGPVIHAPPAPHDPRDLADVGVVATVDAMSVGLSMRTHARTKLTGETAAAYMRIADALIAAGRRALAEGK